MGRITITEIANKLKVAPSTVSRALNNHTSISEKTKKNVITLAEKLNYQPNIMAINLLRRKSNTIGVIVPEITSHFYSAIITSIQDVLSNTPFNLMVCISNESFEEEVVLIQKLEKLQVDGVLVSTSSETKNFDHLKKLQKKGIPIVIFDRDCPGVKADKVLVDDYSGAFEAVEFLIQSGCKKIAHLGGPHNSSTSKHRLKGYLDALKKHKIPIKKEYIHHVSGFTSKSGIKTSKDLLKLNNPPDAIFAVNDNIAIAAMSVAQKMNLKIPKELSIVGFNDDPHSSFVSPSLSSVLQPVFSIGMLSARILLHHLKDVNAKIEFRHEVFKTELITRESSKLL